MHQPTSMMIEPTLQRILLSTRTTSQVDFLKNCEQHFGPKRQINAVSILLYYV